ncbi:MAG TPA: pyrimidine dimer DNA glycosylase/endonuclease V [Candidatus Omnitrophota bacterium]|nr:pyrimidine dimer DNA glycosylase/endonuclease V [Candidatus Omnitrophota bacterium]HPT39360.1 pyrimidine dimer DNA glycosylase/endonuclease V [Candidatus Omnitrophota bacterium]
MRIWDIAPEKLCRNHLLGEHRELHAIWSIITCDKKGYSHHPETLRWKGKLAALFLRHEKLIRQMQLRGYRHKSNLLKKLARGKNKQNTYVDSISKQILILKNKKCACNV